MNRINAALLLVLLLLFSCSKQNTMLKIGIIKPSIDHLPLSYGIDRGSISAADYEIVPFSSGWEAQEALIAGRIDAAIMPFTYVWNAASKGYPVRTVSFFERETDAIVTRRDINTAQQLNGKKVGLLKASSLDVLWRDFAHREHIQADMRYFRSPNEAVAALQSGEVDAVVLYVPLVTKLADKYNILHWFGEDYAGHPCCDLAVNTEKLSKAKTKLVKSLMQELAVSADGISQASGELAAFVKGNYGLDDKQLTEAMQHTVFRLGLEQRGKDFEAKMAAVSLQAGYLDRIPEFKEVFLELKGE